MEGDAETRALLTRERHGRPRLSAPNYVTPFAVAAVAGAALDAGTEHRTAFADGAIVGCPGANDPQHWMFGTS